MSFDKDFRRIYRKGERAHHVHDRHMGANKYNQYFYVRSGRIDHVDPDKYQLTITWLDKGERDKIPISHPYIGPAGIIGAFPERGAIGIFAFFDEGEGKGSPLCVGYLPSGLATGLDFNDIQVYPDSLPTSDVNEIFFKFRKLTEGDMIISSPLFATMFLNNNVEIHDAAQDSIFIREGDQSIISTSLNNFVFGDGASVSLGPAIRNALLIYDENGEKIDNNGSLLSLPDGKDQIYIVPGGADIGYDTEYYAEYRVDADEFGTGKLDTNDINSSSDSLRRPVVSFALGNYIGSDITNRQQYGEILKARLFRSANDKVGEFALEKAVSRNGIDEPSILGLNYALHFKNSKSFMGVDKEGHYNIRLAASKINPLGAGRSMSILGEGNLKEVWGSSAVDLNSWDLSTSGGVMWDLGAHGESHKGRSFELKTSRGLYIESNGTDDDGYAKREEIAGPALTTIMAESTTYTGSNTLEIDGLKTENVTGSSNETVQTDKSLNVTGIYTESVIKEKQCKFGMRKTTITSGNDELEVTKGDITESITSFGKKSTSLFSGNIEQSVTTGNVETDVSIGDYKVNVSTGSIEMATSAGTVDISGTNVSVEAQILATIDAKLIKLGGSLVGGVVSGLPGKVTHNDYVTGPPLKGSLKVSIG